MNYLVSLKSTENDLIPYDKHIRELPQQWKLNRHLDAFQGVEEFKW